MFKIFTVFFLLFCSSFIILSPAGSSSAVDEFYECEPFIQLEYNESILEQFILPYDEPVQIPIIIKTKLKGPSVDILKFYAALDNVFLIVHLSIEEVSEGCFASINPPFVRYQGIYEEYQEANATLSFTIDQYLPAFSLKNVKLNLSVETLGKLASPLVGGKDFLIDMPFQVGYLPQLSFSYPEKNVKSIGPDETAVFPIEVENWGNSESNINIEVEDIPEGWQASIINNLTLDTNLFGGELKETLSLNVKPPINFGYHEDRRVIKIKITPNAYGVSDLKGEPHYLYFIVQSQGVSTKTPGFEMIVFITAFILVFFTILNRKNIKEFNKQQGDKKK
jgi:hypothetical protein